MHKCAATDNEFIRLIEIAISITEKLEEDAIDTWLTESVRTTIDTLKAFREMAASGKLPRPSRGDVPQGTGLGLTRGVGEWTENDELLDAVFAVEEYYKTAM